MDRLNHLFAAFHRDESGVTATEYIMLFCLIASVSLMTVGLLGEELRFLFTDVHAEMSSGEIRGGLSSN